MPSQKGSVELGGTSYGEVQLMSGPSAGAGPPLKMPGANSSGGAVYGVRGVWAAWCGWGLQQLGERRHPRRRRHRRRHTALLPPAHCRRRAAAVKSCAAGAPMQGVSRCDWTHHIGSNVAGPAGGDHNALRQPLGGRGGGLQVWLRLPRCQGAHSQQHQHTSVDGHGSGQSKGVQCRWKVREGCWRQLSCASWC